jgi:hypothetical protein
MIWGAVPDKAAEEPQNPNANRHSHMCADKKAAKTTRQAGKHKTCCDNKQKTCANVTSESRCNETRNVPAEEVPIKRSRQ